MSNLDFMESAVNHQFIGDVLKKNDKEGDARQKRSIEKVLIISKCSNSFVQCNLDLDCMRQISTLIEIFVNYFSLSTESIVLYDREDFDYQRIWYAANSSPIDLNKYKVSFLTIQKKIEADLIILHPAEIVDFFTELKDYIEKHSLEDLDLPQITILHDTHHSHATFEIPLIDEFLKGKRNFNKQEYRSLFLFKKSFTKVFRGFTLEQQEELHKHLVSNIVANNEKNKNLLVKKIILLDDHKRRFYIGDTYFWLLNIRKNICSIFPESTIEIICRNPKRHAAISNMLNGSWDQNILFKCKKWEESDFLNADLILCDSDTVHDFCTFLDGKFHLIAHCQVYCYIDTYIKNVEQWTAFNYKVLFDQYLSKISPVEKMVKLRRQTGLSLQNYEEDWASNWLVQHGVDTDIDELAVFIFESSQKSKTLNEELVMEVINYLVSFDNRKILLFDANKMGIASKCCTYLKQESIEKIIVFEGRGLREAMALMANKCVKLILGPCTGLLHLANGVFSYLINVKKRTRDSIPSMIVYVGNVSEYSTEYHPRDWWQNTLIRCYIFCQDSQHIGFKSLECFGSGGLNFNTDARRLQDVKLDHFKEIIND